MTLILIEGAMNSGKTAILTYNAIVDYYTEKRIIFSNYNINIPHYEINRDFMLWLAEKQPSTRGYSFFFDELWLWMDSRGSGLDRINKALSFFFLQSSKGDTKCYFSTQRENQIDLRLRENKHISIVTERRLLIGNRLKKISNRIRDIGKAYYEYIYFKIKEYEHINEGLRNTVYADKTKYIKASWIFPYYDTNQKMKKENQKIDN